MEEDDGADHQVSRQVAVMEEEPEQSVTNPTGTLTVASVPLEVLIEIVKLVYIAHSNNPTLLSLLLFLGVSSS